jgi:hypothetical protein
MGLTSIEEGALGHLGQDGFSVLALADRISVADLDASRRGVVDHTLAKALLDLYGCGKPADREEVQGRLDALASMCGHAATDARIA